MEGNRSKLTHSPDLKLLQFLIKVETLISHNENGKAKNVTKYLTHFSFT